MFQEKLLTSNEKVLHGYLLAKWFFYEVVNNFYTRKHLSHVAKISLPYAEIPSGSA